LRDLGLTATTCPGGAGKWRAEYSEFLRGADVVVVGDNDGAGRDHVNTVAQALTGIAKRVRGLDLAQHVPGCPQGGDVSDWLKAGGAIEQLATWAGAAPEWSWGPKQQNDWDDPDPSILDSRRGELPEFPVNAVPGAHIIALCAHGAGVSFD